MRRLIGVCAFVGLVSFGATNALGAESWSFPATLARIDGFSGVSCVSITACTAVGAAPDGLRVSGTGAAGWVGMRWSIQPTPDHPGSSDTENELAAVSCTARGACTAVGDYSTYDRTGQLNTTPLVERWDGAHWSIQPTPRPPHAGVYKQLFGVSCASSTACTAVGYYITKSGSLSLGLAERWNGRTWSAESVPKAAELFGVSCTSSRACTAVGLGQPYNARDSFGLVERWDGRRWSPQTTPNPPGTTGSVLSGVSCPSRTACTAVGNYGSDSSQQTLAERWDGRSWSIQPTPNPLPNSALAGVSCPSDRACTAVGTRAEGPGSYSATLAERWDGRSWSIYPTPNPPSDVGDNLSGVSCASARFCTAVGGARGGLVERWSPSSARLAGIPEYGCVRTSQTVRMMGSAIASVRWKLDGMPVSGRAVHPGSLYVASISPASKAHKLTVHKLAVMVTFKAFSHTYPITFHRTMYGCPRP
jgi:hypothetical protein